MDNLEHCLFMEFRGGEVFADKPSIKFIDGIGNTHYAKNIQLDISTNATLLTKEVITVLNKFEGGTLRFSIDSFEDEDEYRKWIRFIVDCLIEEDIPNEERDAVATLLDLKTLKDANHKLNNETDC